MYSRVPFGAAKFNLIWQRVSDFGLEGWGIGFEALGDGGF